jgi:hypothetical protein
LIFIENDRPWSVCAYVLAFNTQLRERRNTASPCGWVGCRGLAACTVLAGQGGADGCSFFYAIALHNYYIHWTIHKYSSIAIITVDLELIFIH